VCRELTKTYEEVRRAGLGELAAWSADGVRGEITVVVAGAVRVAGETVSTPAALVGEVEALVSSGVRLKEATGAVAAAHGVSRREVYDSVLAARRPNGAGSSD
jgi:16S rRNA (cytidine1402-2'-O)-methyltransferase